MKTSAFNFVLKYYTWIFIALEEEAWNMKSCQFLGILAYNIPCLLCCLKKKNG